jgi:hypothetical protein
MRFCRRARVPREPPITMKKKQREGKSIRTSRRSRRRAADGEEAAYDGLGHDTLDLGGRHGCCAGGSFPSLERLETSARGEREAKP